MKVEGTSVEGRAESLQKHVEKYLEQGWRIEHYSTAAVSAEATLGAEIKLIHSLVWQKGE